MVFDVGDALRGLAGGLMIGGAATIFLLCLGRIAGISTIAAAILRPWGHLGWREDMAFLGGLVAMPLLMAGAWGAPAIGATQNPALLVAGGLLVGFGTRLGGGCTSGHGICGMSRFSPRSAVATLIFMGVGILVATAVRPLLGG